MVQRILYSAKARHTCTSSSSSSSCSLLPPPPPGLRFSSPSLMFQLSGPVAAVFQVPTRCPAAKPAHHTPTLYISALCSGPRPLLPLTESCKAAPCPSSTKKPHLSPPCCLICAILAPAPSRLPPPTLRLAHLRFVRPLLYTTNTSFLSTTPIHPSPHPHHTHTAPTPTSRQQDCPCCIRLPPPCAHNRIPNSALANPAAAEIRFRLCASSRSSIFLTPLHAPPSLPRPPSLSPHPPRVRTHKLLSASAASFSESRTPPPPPPLLSPGYIPSAEPAAI